MISVISSLSDSTTGENTTTGCVKRLFVVFCDMSQKAIDTTGSGPRPCGVIVAVDASQASLSRRDVARCLPELHVDAAYVLPSVPSVKFLTTLSQQRLLSEPSRPNRSRVTFTRTAYSMRPSKSGSTNRAGKDHVLEDWLWQTAATIPELSRCSCCHPLSACLFWPAMNNE